MRSYLNTEEITTRYLKRQDRKLLIRLIDNIHQFTDEEKKCVVELMDIYFNEGPHDYEFVAAEGGNSNIYGFICFGGISLTDACYDLYWIVSDPKQRGKGIGTRLLTKLERVLCERNARKLFAETSSQENYARARSFYVKNGFRLIAEILDFYKPGDHKLIYEKTLKYTE